MIDFRVTFCFESCSSGIASRVPAMRRVAVLIAISACGILAAADPEKKTWKVGDVEREALVAKPAKAKNPPLVFVWHGHGGTMKFAAKSMPIHDHWPEAIVVYPQGLNTPGRLTDPDGKKSGWQETKGDQKDRDLEFFDAMLKSFADDGIDENRIYSTGHSNGGGFTYLLSAHRGKSLAAVAPSACIGMVRGADPIPVLHIAGENDELVKFEWQQKMIERVKKLNGAVGEGKEWEKLGKIYASKDGAPVATYIHDGSHKYPEAAPKLIAAFFKEHPKAAEKKK